MSREAFEKWAKVEEPAVNLSTFINGAYIYAEAHIAFRAWQAALQSGEPVYAFRRKGFDDFCTCTEERYLELKEKPNTFEVAIFYTAPQQVVEDRKTQIIKGLVDRLEYWINREDTRSYTREEYNAWLALGHNSTAMRDAKALLSAGKETV